MSGKVETWKILEGLSTASQKGLLGEEANQSNCGEESSQTVELPANCIDSYGVPLPGVNAWFGVNLSVMQLCFCIIFSLLRNPSPMVLFVTPIKTHWFSKSDFGTILCSIGDSLSGTVRCECACATVCARVSHVPRKSLLHNSLQISQAFHQLRLQFFFLLIDYIFSKTTRKAICSVFLPATIRADFHTNAGQKQFV